MEWSARLLLVAPVASLLLVLTCLRGVVPPKLAIESAASAREEGASANTVVARAPVLQASAIEPGPAVQPAAAPGSPEAAIRAIVDAELDQAPAALWDALPASYQRDVNDLVHLVANRLNPEAWRWALQIVRKVRPLLQELQARDRSPAFLADVYNRILVQFISRLADRLGECTPQTLEALKTIDVGAELRTQGRNLLPQLLETLSIDLPELVQATRSFKQSSLTVVESGEQSATVQFEWPDAMELDLVSVEGKWVPRWLADNWEPGLTRAREAVKELLPADDPGENHGAPFVILAVLDFFVDSDVAEALDRLFDADGAAAGFRNELFSAVRDAGRSAEASIDGEDAPDFDLHSWGINWGGNAAGADDADRAAEPNRASGFSEAEMRRLRSLKETNDD